MFTINVKLTLVSIFIPNDYWILFFIKELEKSFEKVDIEEGKLFFIAQENLTGVRSCSHLAENHKERERFEAQNEN